MADRTLERASVIILRRVYHCLLLLACCALFAAGNENVFNDDVGKSGDRIAHQNEMKALRDEMRRQFKEIRDGTNDAWSQLSAKVEALERENDRLRMTITELRDHVAYLRQMESAARDYARHRSCEEIRHHNPSLPSAMYWIDPDGEGKGDPPMRVHCDMTSGVTSVLHDSEASTSVEYCANAGCFTHYVTYSAPLAQMASLADVSAECHQSIQFECVHAPFWYLSQQMSWWKDRNGVNRFFWSGSEINAPVCQCAIDGDCVDSRVGCNCDALSVKNATDTGTIQVKALLPVTALQFGAAPTLDPESFQNTFTLGRLQCSGSARPVFNVQEELQILLELLDDMDKNVTDVRTRTAEQIEATNARHHQHERDLKSFAALVNETRGDLARLKSQMDGHEDTVTSLHKRNEIFANRISGRIYKIKETMEEFHPVSRGDAEKEFLDLCERDRLDTFEYSRLVRLSGIVNVKTTKRSAKNALHLVVEHHQTESLFNLTQLLIERGINVKEKTKDGQSALEILIEHNHSGRLVDVARLFIDKGVSVHEKNRGGPNALHALLWLRNSTAPDLYNMARLLVERQVNIKERDSAGKNVLHLLLWLKGSSNELFDTVKLLVDRGIDPQSKTPKGETYLHLLCEYGQSTNMLKVAEFLLQSGIDVKAKTIDGKSALTSTRENIYVSDSLRNQMMNLLRTHGLVD